MIPIAYPLIGREEAAAIQVVLLSGSLSQGERVSHFEQRFAQLCHVSEAIAVSSGTTALHLALLGHGIGPGDEVITTAFSFAATVHAILYVGATPVFVDIDADTYTINPDLLEAAITSRTRAILPVHLYGQPCAMPAIVEVAQRHHLLIIEDACQAHAASDQGKMVGSFGTGCFSFYATKNMTTGEGGMLTTNDPDLAARLRSLRNQGQSARYTHSVLGYNYRLTEIQAAMGLVQLDKLALFTEKRITHARLLNQHLDGYLQTPIERAGVKHVYHQYTIRVAATERAAWREQLQKQGVMTAVHYPLPLHQQPLYQSLGIRFRCVSLSGVRECFGKVEDGALPVCEQAAREVVSLPVHPALSVADLEKIANEVQRLCLSV